MCGKHDSRVKRNDNNPNFGLTIEDLAIGISYSGGCRSNLSLQNDACRKQLMCKNSETKKNDHYQNLGLGISAKPEP